MGDIKEIAEKALDGIGQVEAGPGDYVVDGILHCGTCKEPKQRWIDVSKLQGRTGEPRILVRSLCSCEKAENERRRKEEAYQEELRAIEKLKLNSLMDSKLRSASLDTFQQTPDNSKIYKIASRYVESFDDMYKRSQGLLFWGTVGTGKTYTAACIANELMNRLQSVIMTSFVRILQDVQNPKTDESSYIHRLNSVKLLIIDDLGTERDTGYAIEKVYNIIDSRYLSGKPLILTTNLSLAEMQDCTDVRYKRVYDRIFEMCYPVKVSGTSWRIGQAAQRFDDMKNLLEG